MADLINKADLTFNGKEIQQLSEAVFEAGFANPDLGKLHKLITGVAQKQQIVIMGRLDGLLGKGNGGCNPASSGNQIKMSEKFWNPVTISDRLEACWTTLEPSFIAYGLNSGVAKGDLTKTDFFNFVSELVLSEMYPIVLRNAWFGDVDADDVDGTGVLTSGTELDYFNKIDGIWKQAFAIVGADALRLTDSLSAKNAEATYSAQAFDDTDLAARLVTRTLQKMKYGADLRLRSQEGLKFITTQSVADQYEQELIDANVSFTTERLENGITILKNGSIELIAFSFWDRIIAEHYDNGTSVYLPHRIVLSTVNNIQIATENETNLSELDVHYDKVTKLNYVDFAFNLDAKIIEDHLVQFAY